MSRSWKDVKADKEKLDRAAGRDVDAARADARRRIAAYVVGYRRAELCKEAGRTRSAGGSG
ncbi:MULTISPECIES: hypothetical protein [unclassified Crossiella]|uniref:hypothetical protein n=1 Tax=unclassified Crossiella TaxID=2620835 RepID=UPI001FFFF645|nr:MULTISPECIES: hypothetical protein [unclassified Crossiella]MCK2241086.1 hypothetical protein [Crossiella sp. S99.2]MCK2253770.1 hypothetical protein [Crossiella sp. S99.1]